MINEWEADDLNFDITCELATAPFTVVDSISIIAESECINDSTLVYTISINGGIPEFDDSVNYIITGDLNDEISYEQASSGYLFSLENLTTLNIEISDGTNCTPMSLNVINDNECTPVISSNLMKSKFSNSVYPTLFNERLTIENQQQNIQQLSIYNLNGQMVYHVNNPNILEVVNTNLWVSGTYFIKIQNDNKVFTKKLVKY